MRVFEVRLTLSNRTSYDISWIPVGKTVKLQRKYFQTQNFSISTKEVNAVKNL